MKLKVEYWKTSTGSIKVDVVVVNQEDYPTSRIFDADADPFSEDYVLEMREERICTTYADSPAAAVKVAHEAVRRIADRLNEWRGIMVPAEKEFTI